MSSVIKVENLSKQYRLGQVGTGTISHDVNRWWHKIRGKEDPYLKIGDSNDRTVKGDSDYVWALKDINFEVKQGEVLGIIGRNGAGKSTLLKILSRTTAPTTGSVKIKGRVASLLEVGTGFHPELSGRDNIFLNGAILGMTRREIQNKFDEIVDFAGVERYIDTPVKRYSSGMYVRLAFAVAAHLEPEILIVDEVLAVGDAEFQKKCLGKMKDVSVNQGKTVLFVSHFIPAVKTLCNRILFLENGVIKFSGDLIQGILEFNRLPDLNKINCYTQLKSFGNYFKLIDLKCNGLNMYEEITLFDSNILTFVCLLEVYTKVSLSIEIKLYTEDLTPIAFASPVQDGHKNLLLEKGHKNLKLTLELPDRMNKSKFFVNFYLANPGFETYLMIENTFLVEFSGYTNYLGNSFDASKAGILFLKSELQ